ncbi:MAG: TIGR02757 family protein [Sedimentisphaerales bacterium]|nr:TIGR02757 family protein [Sedimentisphaerales bacterium]
MKGLVARTQAVVRGSLRDLLDRVYARYNHRQFVGSDPLQFVYRFPERSDVEIAAFLASALAYGRVRQIERSLRQLFDRMNGAPYDFTMRLNGAGHAKLRTFKHRFTTGSDISDLLGLLRHVLGEYADVESFFLQGYDKEHPTVLPALSTFCDSLCDLYADAHRGRVSDGTRYLLASPSRGSASKRLHLFLRWMVRRDEVDLGLWGGVDKAKLIVPVDVHMARLCRILGFHDDRTISRSTAVKITEAFARIEPADPAKYDFALSRIGIVENCTGRHRPECQSCELYGVCRSAGPSPFNAHREMAR